MTRPSGQSGQVMPLVAVCLAVLMGFGGLAVDVGYWEYQQHQQQNATDAAAIGGAQQLAYSGCNNQTAAQTAGYIDSAKNNFANGGNVTVVVNNPPSTGAYAANTCAVDVQITSKNVASFFTRVLGISNVKETTEAVAQILANGAGCIYMLDSSQNTNFHGATVQAPKCSIYLNGSANFNAGSVNAAFIGEGNASGSNNSGTFTSASPAPMAPVADPCPEIAGCEYLTQNPPSTSPCNSTYSGSGPLAGGCYNNLNMNGATVTLASGGVFVFAGGSNFNKASITGSGVTIYIPSGATTNFNKVSSMTLTPPTSGDYTGVTYYQVPSNSGDVNFNGSSTSLSGLIYAPTAAINYNGSQGLYTVLVAAYANFNNSGGQDFGPPVSGQSLIKTAVLSQ